uniref:ABC transporter domain-containing protein n=1 Tax=Kalanchoe fedtschenkoi TaxID=63787 RepID=A0A7N0U0L7_KALFE
MHSLSSLCKAKVKYLLNFSQATTTSLSTKTQRSLMPLTGENDRGGLPKMTDSCNTVLAYPVETNSRSTLQRSLFPITLKFDEVVYKIKLDSKGTSWGSTAWNTKEKTILNGITGVIFPGEMLAMLGPSGSGKTTLLSALGGRLGGKLSGKITYNNQPFSGAIKRQTGFVAQDDVLYPHLTVTETLVFTALLRLPKTLSWDEKVQHVEQVIAELGLSRCRNSMIGGPLFRGISGGEKKRVSIGQEMLINPSLLLLDEPTSGLDSTTAQRIMTTIKSLASAGRTVITTIHQPSSRLYHMFDKVILLSEGCSIYYGSASAALDYFSSIGYSTPLTINPADLLLDLANGISPDLKSVTDQCENVEEELKSVKDALVAAYEKNIATRLKAELCSLDVNSYSYNKDTCTRLLFFFAVFWGFYPLYNAVFTFPQERQMLIKERSSGMYRLSSYFLARTVGDLPLEIVLPTAFVCIIYWMGGLKPDPVAFILSILVVIYNVLVAQSLGLAIGAILMDIKQATTLASVTTLVFLAAGGYYVQQIPPFIVWIKYLSYSYYCYKLLLGVHYDESDTYECSNGVLCRVVDYPAVRSVGLNNLWLDVCAMAMMLVGYRFLAYLALHRVRVR